MKLHDLEELVENLGQKYSEILNINLSDGKEKETFKWFLASLLFGAPIKEKAAIKTFRCFEKHGVLTPERILETGWEGLVRVLDEGGYTRYDFKTADKLLEVMRNLTEKYSGSLTTLHNQAADSQNLEKRLKELGKGVGDVTVGIFLRELRDVWRKANPQPSDLTVDAARKLGILSEGTTAQNSQEQLKSFWSKNKIAGKSFINFETALLRLGKDFCRRGRCVVCSFRDACLDRAAL